MDEALRIILAKSPANSRVAIQAMRSLSAGSPMGESRAKRAIQEALRDPQATFTESDRSLLVSAPGDGPRLDKSLDVRVRVNEDEKRYVQKLAEDAGQTVSDYIRHRLGLPTVG